jgi:hypothetical protein
LLRTDAVKIVSDGDKFEATTRIQPSDMDEEDVGVATEAAHLEPASTEAATQIININTNVTDESIAQPSLLRIKEEHRRTDSNRKETTLERVPRVGAISANEDGTSPGLLLPTPEQEAIVPEVEDRVPDSFGRVDTSANAGFVRPVSAIEVNQDVTAPIAEDPSERKARSEPTMTNVARKPSPSDRGADRTRARSDSILQRIGVRAEVPMPRVVSEPTPKEPVATRSIQPGIQKNNLWLWAAAFGVLAFILVIVATLLFTRS